MVGQERIGKPLKKLLLLKAEISRAKQKSLINGAKDPTPTVITLDGVLIVVQLCGGVFEGTRGEAHVAFHRKVRSSCETPGMLKVSDVFVLFLLHCRLFRM